MPLDMSRQVLAFAAPAAVVCHLQRRRTGASSDEPLTTMKTAARACGCRPALQEAGRRNRRRLTSERKAADRTRPRARRGHRRHRSRIGRPPAPHRRRGLAPPKPLGAGHVLSRSGMTTGGSGSVLCARPVTIAGGRTESSGEDRQSLLATIHACGLGVDGVCARGLWPAGRRACTASLACARVGF